MADGTCDFDGSDIGGIGAVISYGCIAGATTILAVFAILHYLWADNDSDNDDDKEQSDVDVREPPKLGADMFDLSLGFWDTIVWFGIVGALAASYSTWAHKAESVYEVVLNIIVTCMLLNATAALTCLYLYKDAHKEPNHNIRVCAQLAAAMVNLAVVALGWWVWSTWDTYLQENEKLEDKDCYGPKDTWVKQYLLYAVILQLVVLIIVVAYAGLFLWVWIRSEQLNGQPGYRSYAALTAILGVGFMIALWLDFTFILLFRGAAWEIFPHPPFNQDNYSYSQVVSAGLAIQSVWYFVGVLFRHGLS